MMSMREKEFKSKHFGYIIISSEIAHEANLARFGLQTLHNGKDSQCDTNFRLYITDNRLSVQFIATQLRTWSSSSGGVGPEEEVGLDQQFCACGESKG